MAMYVTIISICNFLDGLDYTWVSFLEFYKPFCD